MALKTRRNDSAAIWTAIAALNATRRDATVVGSRFHSGCVCTRGGTFRAPTATNVTIASANASDLATSLTLANEIKLVYGNHIADGTAVHKAVDSVNVIAAADATDLATAQTLANELKADYEAHRASTTYHYNADGTNTIAAADATNLASLQTLLNELKTDINAHMASAVAGFGVTLVDA